MSALDGLLLVALVTVLLMLAVGRQSWAGWLATALYGWQLLLLIQMAPALAGGEAVLDSALRFEVLGTGMAWSLSGLGWFFAVLTAGAAFFSAWYAAGAWASAQPRMGLFHVTLALNVLAMLILLSSGDLLSLFVGWELVSWASYLMMAQRGGVAGAAAYRYLIYAMAGAMAVLAGIVLLHGAAGSFGLEAAREALANGSDGFVWSVVLLLGAGFAVKMGFMPFHLWQAPAYAETPGPGAAFLGAISGRMGLFTLLVVLVNLVGLARLTELSIPFTFLDARDLWAWLAALTIIGPTYIALIQHDARMLLAWHGIGQGGYMLLGVMVDTPMGVAGGLLHVFNYATYQAALFLAITAVVYRTGTADLNRLGGLINRMPLSYVTLLLGIIGLAGLPPMNGFVSKWLVYKSLLDAEMPLLFVAAVIGTLGTILSVYKLIHNVFLGQLRQEHAGVKEAPWSMTLPMLLLVGIAFVTGFFPGLALDLVAYATRGLGLPMLNYHPGGVEWATGSLDMRVVVGALLGAFAVGAFIFYVLGGRSAPVTQLDNYAGGHFLTAETRYHYSHDFYAGLLRVTGPWYRGSVLWLEGGLVSLARVLASAANGLYRAVNGPLYLLVATVLGLWAVAALWSTP